MLARTPLAGGSPGSCSKTFRGQTGMQRVNWLSFTMPRAGIELNTRLASMEPCCVKFYTRATAGSVTFAFPREATISPLWTTLQRGMIVGLFPSRTSAAM